MLPPSPALNLSQHQGLFHLVSSLLQVAKVLELQLQYQAFSLIFRVDFFRIDLICLLSKGLSRVFSRTTIWKASIHESAKSYYLLGKKFVSLGIKYTLIIGSVQFSCSVVSDSSQPHESEHKRPPCPSPPPGVYPNSCPSSWWCHPAISSSVVPFSSWPQSLPASGSFSNESALRMRWPKCWSFSFSISPSNEHPGLISFRMDWIDLNAQQFLLKRNKDIYSEKYFL